MHTRARARAISPFRRSRLSQRAARLITILQPPIPPAAGAAALDLSITISRRPSGQTRTAGAAGLHLGVRREPLRQLVRRLLPLRLERLRQLSPRM